MALAYGISYFYIFKHDLSPHTVIALLVYYRRIEVRFPLFLLNLRLRNYEKNTLKIKAAGCCDLRALFQKFSTVHHSLPRRNRSYFVLEK